LFACTETETDGDTKNNLSSEKDMKSKLKKQDKYIIASYNVENLFDTIDDKGTKDEEFTPEGYKHWTKKRYNKKIEHLSWVLRHLSKYLPAVVGLCEVEHKSVVQDLAKNKALKKGNYKVIHQEGPDTRGIDVALMYRSDLFNVIGFEEIPVIVPEAPEAKLRNILHVWGNFADDEVFHFFINHWKSRRGGTDDTEFKRIATAKILRNKCDDLFKKDKNANIVIMGDFNDVPQSKSINKVLNATDNTENPRYDELYNLLYDKSLEGEGTNSRDYKWYMLDNLIVSQALRRGKKFYAGEGQVFKNDKILYYNAKANFKIPNKTYGGKNYYGGYSDHLPVYFILSRIEN
jgi:predicted extracellular nuclease